MFLRNLNPQKKLKNQKSVNYFLALMKDAKKELLILTENKN